MLVGRDAERQMLDRLLQQARGGQGGVLVLRGEPGIGKTTLLEYAASDADAMLLLRASGFESETGMAFAGLYSLLRPLTGQLDTLPRQQAEALRAALGLDGGRGETAPERLAIAAGTHSLLTTAAGTQPLLLLVDDTHWLDQATMHALAFALRRLAADPIACVLTAQPGDDVVLAGLRTHNLAGLDAMDAALLIEDVAGTSPGRGVGARLCAETGGNPLALHELAVGLPAEQLHGPGKSATGHLPLDPGAEVRQRYGDRLGTLEPALRITLLVAAAAGRCDAQAVLAAAVRAGGSASLADAEDERLVRLTSGSVEFVHPLVRLVAYHSATPSQRRAAHRALADVLAGVDDERAALHLAHAAAGPDQLAAAALDRAAALAAGRGAPLEAAAAWERAAELSEPGDARTERLLRAAEAALHGGDLDHAERLAAGPAPGLPPARKAGLLAVHGRVDLLRGRMDAAHRMLREAAELVAEDDPELAAELLLESFDAAVEAALVDEAGTVAELLGQQGSAGGFRARLAVGQLAWLRGDPAEGMRLMKQSMALLANDPPLGVKADLNMAAARAWASVGEPAQGRHYAERAVDLVRSQGALGVLPRALADASWMHSQTGNWAPALAQGCEALELARATGQRYLACDLLVTISSIEAAQGRETDCRAHADEAAGLAVELGLPLYRLLGQRQLALLDFGAGRLDEAIGRYEQASKLAADIGVQHPYHSPLPDLIEAYAQAGKHDRARDLLPEFLALVPGEDNPLPASRAERCRGIVADTDFDSHFQHAIGLQEHADAAFQLGRTHLCYGERLRRARRRRDARTQLRAAIEIFDRLDARPWANRARAELRATGETIATGEAPRQLTPQELQIAMMVTEGRTNAEVGRALFLSTRTVEFHLSRAFRKLGVSSRTELTRQLAGAAAKAG
ncbi:MAG TPA: AAA family ATPase [Streptosporangiaceae bacterium]|nr:AAA family ATPase [Streptosporangiaceae bacterium]